MHTLWTTLWTTGGARGQQQAVRSVHHGRPRPQPAPSAVHRADTLGWPATTGAVHTIHTTYYCYWFYLFKNSPLCNPGDERLGPRSAARTGRGRPSRDRATTEPGNTPTPGVASVSFGRTVGRPVPNRDRLEPGNPRSATAADSHPPIQPSQTFSATTATVEVFSMKFRVARDDLADAVAWVAKSLPTRPPVPVLGGILLEVQGSTLTVAGFDYEVSTRATVSGRHPGSFPDAEDGAVGAEAIRAGAGLRSAAGRDHQVAAGQTGRLRGERAAGVDRRRVGPVHPADHAGRGLPAAAADAGRLRARSIPRSSPRRSRRPRSPPAATTRCRC